MKTSQNHICKSVWNTICISFLGPCHQHAILDSSALHHLRTIGPLCPHLSSGKSSSSINSRESRRTCNWTSPTSNVLCFLYLCVISISIYSLVLSFIENLCFFFKFSSFCHFPLVCVSIAAFVLFPSFLYILFLKNRHLWPWITSFHCQKTQLHVVKGIVTWKTQIFLLVTTARSLHNRYAMTVRNRFDMRHFLLLSFSFPV